MASIADDEQPTEPFKPFTRDKYKAMTAQSDIDQTTINTYRKVKTNNVKKFSIGFDIYRRITSKITSDDNSEQPTEDDIKVSTKVIENIIKDTRGYIATGCLRINEGEETVDQEKVLKTDYIMTYSVPEGSENKFYMCSVNKHQVCNKEEMDTLILSKPKKEVTKSGKRYFINSIMFITLFNKYVEKNVTQNDKNSKIMKELGDWKYKLKALAAELDEIIKKKDTTLKKLTRRLSNNIIKQVPLIEQQNFKGWILRMKKTVEYLITNVDAILFKDPLESSRQSFLGHAIMFVKTKKIEYGKKIFIGINNISRLLYGGNVSKIKMMKEVLPEKIKDTGVVNINLYNNTNFRMLFLRLLAYQNSVTLWDRYIGRFQNSGCDIYCVSTSMGKDDDRICQTQTLITMCSYILAFLSNVYTISTLVAMLFTAFNVIFLIVSVLLCAIYLIQTIRYARWYNEIKKKLKNKRESPSILDSRKIQAEKNEIYKQLKKEINTKQKTNIKILQIDKIKLAAKATSIIALAILIPSVGTALPNLLTSFGSSDPLLITHASSKSVHAGTSLRRKSVVDKSNTKTDTFTYGFLGCNYNHKGIKSLQQFLLFNYICMNFATSFQGELEKFQITEKLTSLTSFASLYGTVLKKCFEKDKDQNKQNLLLLDEFDMTTYVNLCLYFVQNLDDYNIDGDHDKFINKVNNGKYGEEVYNEFFESIESPYELDEYTGEQLNIIENEIENEIERILEEPQESSKEEESSKEKESSKEQDEDDIVLRF